MPTEVSTATDYTESDEHHRSARDEKLHADLRAKEIGAVCNLSLLST